MPQLLAFSPRVRPFNEKDMQVLHQVLVKNNIIDPGVMIKQISNSCDEVLEKCSWQGEVVNCSSIFADTLTPDGLCCSFNYNERYEKPKCLLCCSKSDAHIFIYTDYRHNSLTTIFFKKSCKVVSSFSVENTL